MSRRALCACVLGALLAVAAWPPGADAGGKKPAPDAAPAAATAPAPSESKPAAQSLAIPEARALIVMIRSSLMALHHANLTGNYTVLHDLGSETFQHENSPARIGQAFAPMLQHGLDLSQAMLLTPQLTATPVVDGNGLLQLIGFFESEPKQIHFRLAYQAEARGWRLFALSVTPVQTPIPVEKK